MPFSSYLSFSRFHDSTSDLVSAQYKEQPTKQSTPIAKHAAVSTQDVPRGNTQVTEKTSVLKKADNTRLWFFRFARKCAKTPEGRALQFKPMYDLTQATKYQVGEITSKLARDAVKPGQLWSVARGQPRSFIHLVTTCMAETLNGVEYFFNWKPADKQQVKLFFSTFKHVANAMLTAPAATQLLKFSPMWEQNSVRPESAPWPFSEAKICYPFEQPPQASVFNPVKNLATLHALNLMLKVMQIEDFTSKKCWKPVFDDLVNIAIECAWTAGYATYEKNYLSKEQADSPEQTKYNTAIVCTVVFIYALGKTFFSAVDRDITTVSIAPDNSSLNPNRHLNESGQ